MSKIKLVLFDIDGVVTDGKKSVRLSGHSDHPQHLKFIQLKDLDAIGMMKSDGFLVGCISGEENIFDLGCGMGPSLDYQKFGCKSKAAELPAICERFGILPDQICYIGDGKYDVELLKRVGLAVTPADAIDESKSAADVILTKKGGEGCLAELHTYLGRQKNAVLQRPCTADSCSFWESHVMEHRSVVDNMLSSSACMAQIQDAAAIMLECYQNGKKLLLCGNGGSATDAQHLAAELVGRFKLERDAINAEALTANCAVMTAIGNDYDFARIFKRQVFAKGCSGDVLLGLSTSGTSRNVTAALRAAKEIGMKTILFTGSSRLRREIEDAVDCIVRVPSTNTPRIQEMHLLIGHLICEYIEAAKYDGAF